MIEYCKTSIFDSKADAITNPVNMVGVMGAGLALQFKNRYPEMFGYYRAMCDCKKMDVPVLFEAKLSPYRKILLFPTKRHWTDSSDRILIAFGLYHFIHTYQHFGLSSISFPKLGCGLGGLKWSDIKIVMEKYLEDTPINCYIHI